ncbi:MAG: acetylornithine/succinylornithine family transaminase [Gemmatimonadetes bacterium]|nr:acetylornithine/succinylornithine family transaminase [Gemmatimonadota bacterium]
MGTSTMPSRSNPTSTSSAVPTKPNSPSTLVGVYRKPAAEFVRGAGVELFDADGKSYLDFVAGIAVNALGYGDSRLEQAFARALDGSLIHMSNLYRTAPAEKLADALVAASFADQVFFCNSGAEANEGAFKMARRWGRGVGGVAKHEILALRGGFHGRLFGTLAATDRPQYRAPFRPLAGGISIIERDLDDLAASLNPETTAAVIVEPVQGEGGVRVLDPAFMRALRDITRERNVLLILDEIQCGYGRTGAFWAYEHSAIIPDILTTAKPMAGGLPMGAVLATADVASAMQPGDHGTTFGGGPFVASVALHVLERLRAPELLANVRARGIQLSDGLERLRNEHAAIRAVRGIGLMWGVDVTMPAREMVSRAMELGLLVCSAGEHTVRLLPPLIVSEKDVARFLVLFEEAIRG